MSYRVRNLDAHRTLCQEYSSPCKCADCPSGSARKHKPAPWPATLTLFRLNLRQESWGDFVTMWDPCPGSSCCSRLLERGVYFSKSFRNSPSSLSLGHGHRKGRQFIDLVGLGYLRIGSCPSWGVLLRRVWRGIAHHCSQSLLWVPPGWPHFPQLLSHYCSPWPLLTFQGTCQGPLRLGLPQNKLGGCWSWA